MGLFSNQLALKLIFQEEVTNRLSELEKIIHEVENEKISTELIEHIYQVIHTIKGSSAMFGFESVFKFINHLELLYNLLRKGKIWMSHEIRVSTVASFDHIRHLLEDEEHINPINDFNDRKLVNMITSIIGKKSINEKQTPPQKSFNRFNILAYAF